MAIRIVHDIFTSTRWPTATNGSRKSTKRILSDMNLQAAGIPKKVAPTIGISVDTRRANLSEEGLAANVARLKEYKARLIVFPRKTGKPKSGDSKDVDLSKVDTVKLVNNTLPIVPVSEGITEIKKSDMPAAIEGGAYRKLRNVRSEKRMQGVREKRVRDKAEAETAKK